MAEEFDLKELSKRGGVTPRTVHFYIQQGLLPPAGATGPGARYTTGHLLRLRLIRLLQKEHLPLAEIGRRIKGLQDEAVSGLLDERQRRADPGGSAIDYVRGVLAQSASALVPTKSAPAGVLAKSAPARAQEPAVQALYAPAAPAPRPESAARSQWERFELSDGLELHVRRPVTREEQRCLDKLLLAARDILRGVRS